MHQANTLLGQQIEFMGFRPDPMSRHHALAEHPEARQALRGSGPLEPHALLHLMEAFRQVDDQWAIALLRELMGLDQMLIPHGVGGMRGDRRVIRA